MARRYAAALADVTKASGVAREVQEELFAWELMMRTNEQLLEVFRNPTITYEQKSSVLKALIARTRVRTVTANFLQVLLQNHRLADLQEINKKFTDELDQRSNIVSAHVTTARPITDQTQAIIRARIAQLTGSEVRLQFAMDEDLIGGVVTRIGSTIYDGSVRGQLQQLKEKLSSEQ
ncbi:MAG: ATP synthase F1 subunit delta [Pyrinomonadaceae bacterium]|nr:ATP synthase F1 subunit delta [Pyrinomonadaceae bacterium]